MSKYHAVPTVVCGIRFDSKAEAARYTELIMLQKARKITDIITHPKFPLHVERIPIGNYIGDFMYKDLETGERIVEDVKGVLTPLYRWKKRHFEIEYGIKILETRARIRR